MFADMVVALSCFSVPHLSQGRVGKLRVSPEHRAKR